MFFDENKGVMNPSFFKSSDFYGMAVKNIHHFFNRNKLKNRVIGNWQNDSKMEQCTRCEIKNGR